jgi:hypothetical protein
VLAVLATGIALTRNAHPLTPLHLVTLGCGRGAIAVNHRRPTRVQEAAG